MELDVSLFGYLSTAIFCGLLASFEAAGALAQLLVSMLIRLEALSRDFSSQGKICSIGST